MDVADGTWHHTLFVEKLFGLVPAQFIWFIVLTALMQWVYRYHKFGNHIHFVGDNKDSSQMMGINVDKLGDLHKKVNEIENPKGSSSDKQVTNNTMFVGSTAELAKFLKQKQDK